MSKSRHIGVELKNKVKCNKAYFGCADTNIL